MPLKDYNPTTPSLRYTTVVDTSKLLKQKPSKGLVKGKHSTGGRDNNGRMSVRRRGGGHKRKSRIIDFKRDKHNIPGVVASIEYDPNRSAYISLVHYADGEKRYILTPRNVKIGDKIQSGPNAPIRPGNSLPLDRIPVGMTIHNIELRQGHGGQLVRSAGAAGVLAAREGDYATVRLPSGETRMVFSKCCATLGSLDNVDHMNTTRGKAGRNRWLGHRPKVRGVAMNPVDHPHGGGEGAKSGGRHPVSPSGIPTKGYKTRKKKKRSNQFIVKRRRS